MCRSITLQNHIISECSKLVQDGNKPRHAGQFDPLGIVQEIEVWIVQEIEVWQYEKLYMHNPESVLENDTHKLRFWKTNISPNFGQMTRACNNH